MEYSKENNTKMIVEKIKKNKNYNDKYITKSSLKRRVKNSQEFSNIKKIRDDGVFVLKTGEYACLLEVGAIDLSLTSKKEKENFFFCFKDIFHIKEINMKIIKLDKKINLNSNKDNYQRLINKFEDDEKRIDLLKQN